jgi:hypothetical protein
MDSQASQSAFIRPVSQVLDAIRLAFAQKQMESGLTLMERALALNVQWEALTQAVGEGIDAGLASTSAP